MGGKKKVEQPAQQSIADKGHNNQLLLRSSDGKQFRISDTLLGKQSTRQFKEDTVSLPFESEIIDTILHYLHLHQDVQAQPIITPIRSNQSLVHIMEKNDAEYIDRIMKNSDEFIKKILDAATLLEIEDLKKRLYCGIAIKLMSKTLDQLKEIYAITATHNEDELKSEIKAKIEQYLKESA